MHFSAASTSQPNWLCFHETNWVTGKKYAFLQHSGLVTCYLYLKFVISILWLQWLFFNGSSSCEHYCGVPSKYISLYLGRPDPSNIMFKNHVLWVVTKWLGHHQALDWFSIHHHARPPMSPPCSLDLPLRLGSGSVNSQTGVAGKKWSLEFIANIFGGHKTHPIEFQTELTYNAINFLTN